jgi:hypothetical protein
MRIQIRKAWYWQIFLRRRGSECDHGPKVLAGHGRKAAENLDIAGSLSQTRQNRPQKDACAADNRLSTADLRVPDDVVVIVHGLSIR